MAKCKFALVGYGGMGHWHIDKLNTLDEIEICGIYDIDPEKSREAEEKGMRAYRSLEELLADEEVELITIATPNDVHKPIAIQAMNAKKNVICEKPVTMTHEDLQEMFDAAEKNHVVFTVHQNRRWDEDYLIIKKMYEENKLGNVFCIESRVHGSRGVPGDWRNRKAQGGGMVLDWGVHLIDQMLQIDPTPVISVYADLSHVTNDEVDDGFHTVLKFEDGLIARIEVGTSNFISLPRWYMLGENGSAVIENWDIDGKIVMVSDWEKRDAVPVVTAAGLTKTMAPRTEETIREYPLERIPSDVRDFYRNIVKAIRGEEEQIVTHSQMMRVIRVMEAVFASGEQDKVISTRI